LKGQAQSCNGLPKQVRMQHVKLEKHVNITLWDWARGPAGRMTTYSRTADSGQMYVADVGAQVLSVRCPFDEERLRRYGAVDAFGLASTTCERPHDATHLWMPDGLTQLLSMQIKSSLPSDVVFNRRVLSVVRNSQQYTVEAELHSPPHWLARGKFQTGRYQPEHGQGVVKQDFDAVVMAVSAADVLRVHGLAGALGSTNVAALQKVLYDSRLSVAFMLSPKLKSSLETMLADGQSELDFECGTSRCSQGILGLVAWQDRKIRLNDECTVVVVHSTRLFANDFLRQAGAVLSQEAVEDRALLEVTRALSLQLQVPQHFLESSILDVKVLQWHQGQVQRFMTGAHDCLAVPGRQTKTSTPLLLLCGDYFVEATFSGCSRSARAAARVLMGWLQARVMG